MLSTIRHGKPAAPGDEQQPGGDNRKRDDWLCSRDIDGYDMGRYTASHRNQKHDGAEKAQSTYANSDAYSYQKR